MQENASKKRQLCNTLDYRPFFPSADRISRNRNICEPKITRRAPVADGLIAALDRGACVSRAKQRPLTIRVIYRMNDRRPLLRFHRSSTGIDRSRYRTGYLGHSSHTWPHKPFCPFSLFLAVCFFGLWNYQDLFAPSTIYPFYFIIFENNETLN